jgi:multicomponent Na+:H+ antiporter subunit B
VLLYIAEILSVLVGISALALLTVRHLLTVVVLLSVFSAALAITFAILGAVNVAFLEAVVGTSVSTIFFMGLMRWVDPAALTRPSRRTRLRAVLPTVGVGGVLLYGVNALPRFGDPGSPAATHVAPVYAANSVADMASPNVVAAILADYRGFDTMIEAAVVVTAVLACILILRQRHARPL